MALLLQGGVRRSSVGLSDRLKKFESGGNDSAANSTKPAFKEPITRPGKVNCHVKSNLFQHLRTWAQCIALQALIPASYECI